MLQNLEGKQVPEVVFKTRLQHQWVDVSSSEIFAGRTVVVFSLPGAFTPTCSSTHVPRYNQLAPVLKQHGVDEIVCVAVNDGFVMNQWQQEQHADRIRFIPDGNGDFTRAMGMLVAKQDLGFGERSWRYSMLVRDGIIDKMFIEPDLPGDPFEASDAETMLRYLAPQAELPPDVTVFSRDGCPYCVKAKELLRESGIEFDELVLNRHFAESTIRAVSGHSTLPQVFINGALIGGAEELESWLGNSIAA